MMEAIKKKGGRILESLADYVEMSIELVALKTADKSAKLTSGFLTIVILAMTFIFSLNLLTIGIAILISSAFHLPWLGFFIMGAFYTLLGIVLIAVRKKLIARPLLNQILPALVDIEQKAEEEIEKVQDKIETKLKIEKQPD